VSLQDPEDAALGVPRGSTGSPPTFRCLAAARVARNSRTIVASVLPATPSDASIRWASTNAMAPNGEPMTPMASSSARVDTVTAPGVSFKLSACEVERPACRPAGVRHDPQQ
jgi:hypothetical protein